MVRILFSLCLMLGFTVTPAFAENSAAPDFTLRDINKKKVSLSDFKGKVVLIQFWALWCGPCKAEMPHLQTIYNDLKDDGLEILSISIDEARDASKVKPFVKRGKYSFPVLLDKQSEVMSLYYAEGTPPYNALVDRNGNLVWTKLGYAPGDEKTLRKKIENLLKTGKIDEAPAAKSNPAPAPSTAPEAKKDEKDPQPVESPASSVPEEP